MSDIIMPLPKTPPDVSVHSIAFLLYALIIFVIHLYATTGRNAPAKEDRNSIAMTTPRAKWYSRVPNAEQGPLHVVGEDDEEE